MYEWERIAGDLRAQIAQGELAPGDRVPTEVTLAEQWMVSRPTARRALMELTNSGLLLPGSPRRVAKWEPITIHVTREADRLGPGESPTRGADSYLADVLASGAEPGLEIEVVTAEAGRQVAERLELAGEHEPVTGRRQVRYAGRHAQNMITHWFPRAVAAGTPLAEQPSITEGSLAWLERAEGELAHQMSVTSRMPVPDEIRKLNIPPGWPVMIVWRTSRVARTGQPVSVSVASYPADRTELLYP